MKTFFTIVLTSIIFITGCMSGRQRYLLEKERLTIFKDQQVLYQPLVAKGKTTLTAEDGFIITVPLETKDIPEVPNDFEQTINYIKFMTGITGAVVGMNKLLKANSSKTTVINEAPATP